MKYILSLSILAVITVTCKAQSVSDQLADKLAKKMRDSLSLTNRQYEELQVINKQLSEDKSQLWLKYNTQDSLRVYLQKIENKRDSLYSIPLTPQQYSIYKQRKRTLLNNN